jgi:predicted TPR repeat methyltransferase
MLAAMVKSCGRDADCTAGVLPFDLLVAADVFVYIGDLAPVLQAAAAAATER